MREYIAWFNQVLTVAIQLYFQQDTEYTRLEEVRPPVNGWLEKVTGVSDMTFGEQVIIMLALMPHVCPQVLDIFLCRTKTSTGSTPSSVAGKGCRMAVFCPQVKQSHSFSPERMSRCGKK